MPRNKGSTKPRLTHQQVKYLALLFGLGSFAFQFLVWPRNPFKMSTLLSSIWYSCIMAYLPSFFDGSEFTLDGKYSESFTNSYLWKWVFRACTLEFDGEKPDPSKQYIVSIGPHGVASFTHWFITTCFTRKYWPLHRHLGATAVFKTPLWRDWMMGGGIIDAGKENTQNILSSGYNLFLLPGGVNEQVRAQYNQQLLYIKSRTGIFYYALKYNVPIIPIYSFQENTLFYTANIFQNIRNWIADTFSIPICLALPAPAFFYPQLHAYAGNPVFLTNDELRPNIQTEVSSTGGRTQSMGDGQSQESHITALNSNKKNKSCKHPIVSNNDKNIDNKHNNTGKTLYSPSASDVALLQEKYIQEMTRIYNKYREKEGYANKELVIE